ncbi:MAG: nucleotidyltransferase domain-containing protein [Sedimentisphaerales bacterium]
MIDIEKLKPEIEHLCKNLPVKRLGLFGSAIRGDFSHYSDIDVLVVFDADENIDLFEKYFDLKENLEEIFKRKVDLVVDRNFRNPVLKDSIERTRIIVYER